MGAWGHVDGHAVVSHPGLSPVRCPFAIQHYACAFGGLAVGGGLARVLLFVDEHRDEGGEGCQHDGQQQLTLLI